MPRQAPFVLACVLAFLPIRVLSLQQPQTAGLFTDRAGARHAWSVNSAHALTWDGAPYIPVGGVFCPRYLADGQTEQNWAADAQALGVLKSKGVLDVIINPVVSAADVPTAAWQKLIDHLDAGGFRYGICFGSGITRALTGIQVRPGTYREPNVRDGGEITWKVPGAESGRFVIADTDGTVHHSGELRFSAGKASTTAPDSIVPGSVALLYPRKAIKPDPDGWIPDIWAGYDSYRDRLLQSLGRVQFGPGLRFFLDPLAHPLRFSSEADSLVPDSPGFLLEWEAFLARKYRGVDELLANWAVLDREVESYRHAAALIPLWFASKGVPYLYDPVKNRLIEMDRNSADQSRFWQDLRLCRNESMVYYMNNAADLLKRNLADVPVIYTYTDQHRMFTNHYPAGGFDGLGIAAYGRGTALVTGGASAAYAQANESGRATWLLVTEMLDAPLAGKLSRGYESELAMGRDLDWLRGIGAKGFFVNGFQVLPESGSGNAQLLRSPEQIDWLKRYADRAQQGSIASSRPLTLPYPASAAGLVSEGPIAGGSVWWVPSLSPGKPLEFGSSYAGYVIALPEGDTTVLWSLTGPRETRLFVPDPRAVQVTTADGRPVATKPNLKKRYVTLVMDRTPVVIRGVGDDFLPLEAIDDSLQQLHVLLAEAESAKIPVHEARNSFDSALRSLKNEQPRLAFLSVVDGLNKAGGAMQPYTWIEAEGGTHTFSEAAPNEAASGGGLLVLNTEAGATGAGYQAQYRFSVPRDDMYMIWAAVTPPGPDASPFYWTIDSDEPQTSGQAVPVGGAYLHDRLTWLRLGRAKLRKGDHTLTLRVTDKASGSGRFFLAVDALMATRYPFTPAGTTRPPLAVIPGKPAVLTPSPRRGAVK